MDDENFEGNCHGGPFDGRNAISRFPKGFLLVDKPGDRAWLYDWNGTEFVCRDPKAMTVDFDGRVQAAEGGDFDVLCWEVEPK